MFMYADTTVNFYFYGYARHIKTQPRVTILLIIFTFRTHLLRLTTYGFYAQEAEESAILIFD